MAKSNKSLVNLALGGNKKATPAKKKEVVVEKKLSPEEERDLKAKETVKNLLDGAEIDLTPKPKEESLLEVDETQVKSADWFKTKWHCLQVKMNFLKANWLLQRAIIRESSMKISVLKQVLVFRTMKN